MIEKSKFEEYLAHNKRELFANAYSYIKGYFAKQKQPIGINCADIYPITEIRCSRCNNDIYVAYSSHWIDICLLNIEEIVTLTDYLHEKYHNKRYPKDVEYCFHYYETAKAKYITRVEHLIYAAMSMSGKFDLYNIHSDIFVKQAPTNDGLIFTDFHESKTYSLAKDLSFHRIYNLLKYVKEKTTEKN